MKAFLAVPPLLLVACSSSSQSAKPHDAGAADATAHLEAAAGPVITAVTLVPNPNNVLSATLTFTTDRPAVGSARVLNMAASTNVVQTPPETAPVTSHSIAILGMRAQSTFAITISAVDEQGLGSTSTTTFQTPALPATLPSIHVVKNDKSKTAPGFTVLDVLEFSGNPVANFIELGSAIIALDSDLEIVWYMPGVLLDPQKLPSGHYVTLIGHKGWGEFDMMGNIVQQFSDPQLGLDTLSHTITPESSPEATSILSLSTQLRYISGYGADGGTTYPVVGSLVVEMGQDGGAKVISNTFDFFNPHYEGPNNLSMGFFQNNFWQTVYPDAGQSKDWIHGNSVYQDHSDDSIVASSRTLSWIYKVHRDGTLAWKLGPNGDFTLTNQGDTFQYAQHGVYVTPQGTIMCYDDGNGRPLTSGQAPFSRALEMSLDTGKMEATIVWQFQDGFYSAIFGSSYRLSNGNVLVDAGCNLADPAGSPADPTNLKTARVMEVTHDTPAVIVAEVDLDVPLGGYAPDPSFSGFPVYRAYKWASLY